MRPRSGFVVPTNSSKSDRAARVRTDQKRCTCVHQAASVAGLTVALATDSVSLLAG